MSFFERIKVQVQAIWEQLKLAWAQGVAMGEQLGVNGEDPKP